MIYFHNDYSEGCHEKVLQRLTETNLEQTTGYGCDEYCAAAREALRRLPVTMSIDQRVRALTLEAASFRRDGAHAKALNALRTAVNLKPNDVNLRLNFVKTLERAGRLEEALREIVFCRDKSPRDQDLEHIESIEKRIQKKQSQRVHSARKKSLGID